MRISLSLAISTAVLAARLFAQDPVAVPVERQPLAEERQPGFASIDPQLCRKWLTYLASDELAGRETGTPGYKKAAEFIAERFAEFGLKPVGDDGTYFQHVPFFIVGPTEGSHVALVSAEGEELLRLETGTSLGGRIAEKSDKRFALVALEAASADDVEEAGDLEGAAVLLFDKSPRSRRGTEASIALRRARAGAVITVADAQTVSVEQRVSSGGGGNRARTARFRQPNSYTVPAALGVKIRTLLEANEGVVLQTAIDVAQEPVFGANVVGYLEGSDPALKAEIVGIGSHLDHIGARGDVINNGADDDGSGTTGVLAVARAFTSNPVKPRRSILFMCFAGEEKGLIGSRYYTENPIFPNEEMIAELQMDMIGRREEKVNRRTGEVLESADDNVNTLHLVGTEKLSKQLHELCLSINDKHVGFEFEYDEEGVFSRSDHANFARKDIPIAFFFTGFHPQYHRPDDTVDKIDFPKLARVAKLVYAVAFEIANADQRVKRDRLWSEIPRSAGRQRRGK